jgi:hypothetical protein
MITKLQKFWLSLEGSPAAQIARSLVRFTQPPYGTFDAAEWADATSYLPPQNNQLISERGVLLKPVPRLEWRDQDGQDKI